MSSVVSAPAITYRCRFLSLGPTFDRRDAVPTCFVGRPRCWVIESIGLMTTSCACIRRRLSDVQSESPECDDKGASME